LVSIVQESQTKKQQRVNEKRHSFLMRKRDTFDFSVRKIVSVQRGRVQRTHSLNHSFQCLSTPKSSPQSV
jgi:hypothetical protein